MSAAELLGPPSSWGPYLAYLAVGVVYYVAVRRTAAAGPPQGLTGLLKWLALAVVGLVEVAVGVLFLTRGVKP